MECIPQLGSQQCCLWNTAGHRCSMSLFSRGSTGLPAGCASQHRLKKQPSTSAITSWRLIVIYDGLKTTSSMVHKNPCHIPAFKLLKGIPHYPSLQITFSFSSHYITNRLSQYSVYKKAFHTTTHQINTSHWMEKSAAPEYRTDFTPCYLGTCRKDETNGIHLFKEDEFIYKNAGGNFAILTFTKLRQYK